jgi:hypothetical protein
LKTFLAGVTKKAEAEWGPRPLESHRRR